MFDTIKCLAIKYEGFKEQIEKENVNIFLVLKICEINDKLVTN